MVLSAAAGMRMGFALISTGGLSREASLVKSAREAFPTACAAMCLFIGAAVIEGFISPSGLPYWFKAGVAAVTSGSLMVYFLILGFPRGDDAEATP
ncbi:MAG: stage II sporulation protein M [Pirellulales bacterium]